MLDKLLNYVFKVVEFILWIAPKLLIVSTFCFIMLFLMVGVADMGDYYEPIKIVEKVQVEVLRAEHVQETNFWHRHYYEYIHHDTGTLGVTSGQVHVSKCYTIFREGDTTITDLVTIKDKDGNVIKQYLGDIR